MSDLNGSGGRLHHQEPWRKLMSGVVVPDGDGQIVPQKKVIKTQRGAPHLAVCMPVGGKDVVDVAGCEHCHRRTRIRPGSSYHGPGLVPVELLVNFMQVMSPLNVSISFYTLKNHLSSVLRESMTRMALEAGANFIFYWDDDVFLPANTWYRMLIHMAKNPDVGAITGVYFTKKVPSEPVLYKHSGQGAYWGFDTDPEAPVEDVYAAGAGCMMVRADAIRQMEGPWWLDERITSEDYSKQSVVGHDIRFFRKLHEETGCRVVVDGSIQCTHFDVFGQRAYVLPDDSPPAEMARERAEAECEGTAGFDENGEKPPVEPISVQEVERVLSLE